MDRPRSPRRRTEAPSAPTSLHEITRRYYACAVALAKAMGLPLTETFLREHRESISCCFIEAGRACVRLDPAVPLPPLTLAHEPLITVMSSDGQPVEPGSPLKSDLSANGDTPPVPPDPPEAGEIICGMPAGPALEPTSNGHTPPTVVPKDAGLPCGGVLIGDLKPAQLAMLVSKVATLVHAEGERWIGLLSALQIERGRRLENGGKRPREG